MNQKPKRKEILKAGYATVGELKKFIKKHKIPDNALILYERIEDYYFKKGGWYDSICVVRKPSEMKGIDNTFVTVWSPIKYKRDDNLYLSAHYWDINENFC